MTDIYDSIITGLEQMQLGIPAEALGCKSVNQILNNPSRLAFEFKRTQARFDLTCNLIDDILRGKV